MSILLFSIVCCQPTELILGFLFYTFSNFTPLAFVRACYRLFFFCFLFVWSFKLFTPIFFIVISPRFTPPPSPRSPLNNPLRSPPLPSSLKLPSRYGEILLWTLYLKYYPISFISVMFWTLRLDTAFFLYFLSLYMIYISIVSYDIILC